jgi:thymidylate synthase
MSTSLQHFELDYRELVKDILHNGIERQTRNAKTKSVFGRTLRVNVEPGEFPLLNGRKMFYKGIVGELAAFLKGPKTIKDFEDQGCNYWEKWGNPDGTINVDYGNSWLDFNGVNQLDELVETIKKDPYGRRHIVTGWRPDKLKDLNLPCCHLLYQWYVRDQDGIRYLDMIWYQRSVDTMIGLPSDIILAYVLNLLVANDVKCVPGEIIMNLGDTHIYEPHYEGAQEYIDNVRVAYMDGRLQCPRHEIVNSGLKDFKPEDISIYGYNPMPKINFELLA